MSKNLLLTALTVLLIVGVVWADVVPGGSIVTINGVTIRNYGDTDLNVTTVGGTMTIEVKGKDDNNSNFKVERVDPDDTTPRVVIRVVGPAKDIYIQTVGDNIHVNVSTQAGEVDVVQNGNGCTANVGSASGSHVTQYGNGNRARLGGLEGQGVNIVGSGNAVTARNPDKHNINIEAGKGNTLNGLPVE